MDFNGSVDPIVQTVSVDGNGIKTESIHLSEIVSDAIMKFINFELYPKGSYDLFKVIKGEKTVIDVLNSEKDVTENKKTKSTKLDGEPDKNLVQKRFRSFK